MRNKLLILLLLLAVVGFAFGLTIKNSEPQTTDQPTTQDQPGDTTDIETVIISPEKPASFDGVEMMTYKSPAGYEITYPVQWIAKEVPAPAQSNDIFARYSISPVEPLDKLMNPMIIIRVWKTDKNFLQPDASLREKQIALNGQKGGFFSRPKWCRWLLFFKK